MITAKAAAEGPTSGSGKIGKIGNGYERKYNSNDSKFQNWCENTRLLNAIADARVECAYVRIMLSYIEELLTAEGIARFGDSLQVIDNVFEWAEHELTVAP